MSVVLQERDHKILRLCLEQQFILSEHAEDIFEHTSTYRNVINRVQELCEAGYLKPDETVTLGRRPIYRATKLGADASLQFGGELVPQSRNVNQATLIHDALVTSVRLCLARYWNAKFIPERALKVADFRQVPDGIFRFESGRAIAIEVENSDKGRSRFVSLLQRWAHIPDIGFVLYVATSDALYNSIVKWLPHGPKDQPMGVVKWEALRLGARDVTEVSEMRTATVWTVRGPVGLFDKREY